MITEQQNVILDLSLAPPPLRFPPAEPSVDQNSLKQAWLFVLSFSFRSSLCLYCLFLPSRPVEIRFFKAKIKNWICYDSPKLWSRHECRVVAVLTAPRGGKWVPLPAPGWQGPSMGWIGRGLPAHLRSRYCVPAQKLWSLGGHPLAGGKSRLTSLPHCFLVIILHWDSENYVASPGLKGETIVFSFKNTSQLPSSCEEYSKSRGAYNSHLKLWLCTKVCWTDLREEKYDLILHKNGNDPKSK